MTSPESAGCEVSACMATYNGSRYVVEQVTSILSQLSNHDELVVVDDASQDNTVALLRGLGDPRIRLIQNEKNRGVVRSFERAIGLARGQFIFLSDQDDVWIPAKVEKLLTTFRQQPSTTLVMSDALIVDAEGKPTGERWSERRPFSAGIIKNLIQNSYVGCLMAFRRELVKSVLPFPEGLPMHDMWIGMVNQMVGKVRFIEHPLVCYRRHTGTVTTGKHASWWQMARWRWRILHLICLKALTLRTASR